MNKHLVFEMRQAYELGETDHPQTIMKKLGITYMVATPQSISDQWWFWNCKNIPDVLPDYLSELDIDPIVAIGWGLSKETAEKIKNYKYEI